MTSPRHIAPARPSSVATNSTSPIIQSDSTTNAVGANDVIFVNGQPFNGRGYPVCGVANQRGRLCGRIGTCPFHARQKATVPKRPRSPNQQSELPPSSTPNAKRARANLNVRQMSLPPQKSRFKRSWTTEEHRIFLQAMRRHGKGKWKEIAIEVKTRTANQCQSHAQKYFLRQAKSDSERKKKSIHDVTENDVADTTWTSLQTAARQAMVAQQQQKPPSAQTIAPAPSRHSLPSCTPTPSVTAAPMSTKAIVSSSSGTVNGVPSTSSIREEPAQTVGIPTVNITGPPGSSSGPVAVTSQPSTLAPTSIAHIENRSGVSTVPVVVQMPGVGVQYAPMVQSFLHPGLGNPSNAAIVTPPPPAKLRVTVHVNGKLKGGMALMLPDALEKFYEIARNKLQFEGSFKRVFTRSGGEITSLDEMCQDDMLWLSTGEDFLTPR